MHVHTRSAYWGERHMDPDVATTRNTSIVCCARRARRTEFPFLAEWMSAGSEVVWRPHLVEVEDS